ncbi:MAG TPA: hypothetical protein VMB03_13765 [Bryobacteraceae bacterium]|nr:hypothetical protein [Bryobacteraceae bacterium]
MPLPRPLESELSYARRIAGAGWESVISARQQKEIFPASTKAIWIAVAVGAGVGVLSRLGKRSTASTVAIGALIGSVVGFGAGIAWESRQFTGAVARTAKREIGAVRDAHWLERHPIDYA